MDQIDELKQMQNFPRFYLYNYFDELKNEIDLKYAAKQDEQNKYIEIIKNIELFEQDAYKKCKSFNTYDEEIKLIEDKLNDSNLNEITQLIDELKYKIERVLFSIFFYDKGTKYSFLVIINDEYIKKERNHYGYDYDLRILTKEKLNSRILIDRTTNKDNINVLNISIASLELINLRVNQIEVIHENTFNGLTNLKKVVLSYNQLNGIDPNLFNELTNLQDIDVCNNKIKVIDEKTLNGLTNLNQIDFSENQIKKKHPNTFFFINNFYIYI